MKNTSPKTRSGYGHFGNLAKTYDKARRSYPDKVFQYIKSALPNSPSEIHVLDVGCGTGISTRQLAERGFPVMGADIDKQMVALAKAKGDGLRYVVAPADHLHFAEASFEVVTAFSALHWFTDPASLAEIARVLKPGGVFVAVNGSYFKGYRRQYKKALEQFMDQEFPSLKDAYDAEPILKGAGFTNISKKIFHDIHVLTIDQALQYLQSTSPWNLVPSARKKAALEGMRAFYESNMNAGTFQQKYRITVVVAHKK